MVCAKCHASGLTSRNHQLYECNLCSRLRGRNAFVNDSLNVLDGTAFQIAERLKKLKCRTCHGCESPGITELMRTADCQTPYAPNRRQLEDQNIKNRLWPQCAIRVEAEHNSQQQADAQRREMTCCACNEKFPWQTHISTSVRHHHYVHGTRVVCAKCHASGLTSRNHQLYQCNLCSGLRGRNAFVDDSYNILDAAAFKIAARHQKLKCRTCHGCESPGITELMRTV